MAIAKVKMRALPAADLAICLLAFLAFSLRLYHLDLQSLTGDEAFTMLAAQRWLYGQMDIYTGAVEPHPPLHFLAMHFWRLLVGDTEYAARFLSVVFGVLLLATVYRLGVELSGRATGLIASLLVATNPFLILYSQTARDYSPLAWLSAFSTLCLVRLLQSTTQACRQPAGKVTVVPKWRHRSGLWLAYGASTLGALYTHTFAVLLIPFHTAAYLLWPAPKPTWRHWLLSQVLIAVLIAPWLLYTLTIVGTPQSAAWVQHGDTLSALGLVFTAFTFGQSGYAGNLGGPLLALGLLLFAIGAASSLFCGRQACARIVPAYLLVPLATAVLISLRIPCLVERYLILLSPAYLLGVSEGIACLLRLSAARSIFLRAAERWTKENQPYRAWLAPFGIAGLAAAVLPAFLVLPGYYNTVRSASVSDLHRLQAYVREHATPSDVAIIDLLASDPYFQYYNLGLPTYFIRNETLPQNEADQRTLHEVLEQSQYIWMIPTNYGQRKNRFVETFLESAAYKTDDRWFGNIQLVRYAVRRAQPPARQPVEASFIHPSGLIRLVGFALGPPQPRPGDVLTLTLYWRSSGPVSKRYTVFTHLVDDTGKTWAQRDSEPMGGRRPTDSWQADEEIADNYGLALPQDIPPGDYQLEVGLYQLQEGVRLQLPNGENRVVLTHVKVSG